MTELKQLRMERSKLRDVMHSFRCLSSLEPVFPLEELEAYRKLPFEVQLIHDLSTDRIHVVKGKDKLDGTSVEKLEAFHKRVLQEDLSALIRVERILLERLKELNSDRVMEISLNASFRMFFSERDLRRVTRNSFVYKMNDKGMPHLIYHMIKDITGRMSHDHVRFKLNCPGEGLNKGFLKTNGIDFTPRENQILELLVQGFTSDEIGKRLFISTQTVSKHRKNMIKKASVSDTRKLVAMYLDSKIL